MAPRVFKPIAISISIHALREEGDRCPVRLLCRIEEFLSTPSARRATLWPSGGTSRRPFLSTPSARRTTDLYRFIADFRVISIHALREEGDDLRHKGRARGSNFYPRPPRGGRRSTRNNR